MASSDKIQFGIFLFVSIALFQRARSACPSDWVTINTGGIPAQSCYKIFPTQLYPFDTAANFCRAQGGYLARDTSQAVHNVMMSYIRVAMNAPLHPMSFWIGLTDNNVTNGPWQWIDGPVLGNFTKFINSTNVPNQRDCVYILAPDNQMRWKTTTNCGQSFAFYCQKDLNAPPVVTTTPARLNCPSGWITYPAGKTCLKLYTTSPLSWSAASAICKQSSGDLVKISDTNINAAVNAMVNSQRGVYWIGLNDRANEGKYVWLNENVTTTFTNWDSNMPNNAGGDENCVVLDGNKNFKWDDKSCSYQNRFICQTNPLAGTPTPKSVPTQSHVNCGNGWEDVPNSDNCLKINTNVLSWLDALADCLSVGGDLTSILNVQEQFYLVGRISAFQSTFFWIGANDRATENGWQWTDSSPFAFLNWADRQPDNSHNSDCAVLVQQTGRWDDAPCENRYGYICKKKGRVTFPSLITTTTVPTRLPGDVVFGCPVGWMNFRGSCYKIVMSATPVNWATASASCSSPTMNGALAAIIDANENQFIFSMLPRYYTDSVWIGFQDPQENTFTWVDGTPVQYTNWNPGEPNNANNEDCVVMLTNNGKWNDAQCNNVYKVYVCKKNKNVISIADSNQHLGCQNYSSGYGSHCYTFVSSAKNFNNAQQDCRSFTGNQGNLVTIDSGSLQAFLSSQVSTFSGLSYWIGLSQNGATYTWKSNWPVSFTYWGMNHTGNEQSTCVGMTQSSPEGLWVNYPCTNVMPYICESPRTGFTTQVPRTAVTSQLPCPSGWQGFRNLCYRAYVGSQNMLPWTDAKNLCASLASGGSLISVADSATQTWLRTNIIQPAGIYSSQIWIGLNDRDSETGYVWADNSPLLFTNWAPNEPNNGMNREDCVEWDFPINSWNDVYCYRSNAFVCQIPRGSVISTPKPPPTGASSPQCGDKTWIMSNNFCYFISPSGGTATWFDARQQCLNVGADLASINGDDENGFLTSQISKGYFYDYWIGLTDLDRDSFGWSDLSPIQYVAWGADEPNDDFGEEKCVELTKLGYWNDVQCQSHFRYICKKRPGSYTLPSVTPTNTAGGCPRGFMSLPSLTFCYSIGGVTNTTHKNFTDAVTACDQMVHKSTLASIHTKLEEKFILVLLSNFYQPAWIGFNDRSGYGTFEWVDNLVVSYTNWGPGQPDENTFNSRNKDCVDVEIFRNPGTWNDRQCNTPLAYICESRKSATLPTALPFSAGCHTGYIRLHNSCYKYYDESLNWTSAENMCAVDGAVLVSFSNGIEQAAGEIMTNQTGNTQFWIGLKYVIASATFSWIDGWPVTYTNWGKDEPKLEGNQNCVSHTVDSQWQVVPCALQLPFICEFNLGSPSPTRHYPSGTCPDNTWINYAGYCYHIVTSPPETWARANEGCRILGANLTSIHSNSESNYLTNVIGAAKKDVWIGLFKGQGTGFAWYDGSPTQFTNWAAGEPNDPDSYLHQDCVKVVSQYGTWADTNCLDQNAYICKKPQSAQSSFGSSTYHPTNQGYSNPSVSSSPVQNQRSSRGPRTGWPHRGSSHQPYTGPRRRSSHQPYTGPHRGSSHQPYTGPHRRTSHPPNTRNTPNAQRDSGSSGVGGGAVAGIVIGTIVLVALAAVIGILVYRYKKGQLILPFAAQRLTSQVSGFNNASYSSNREDKVNLDANESEG